MSENQTGEAKWPPEPIITVNGTALTIAQAMTVRVALETFAMSLADGLGPDEASKAIAEGYLSAIRSIRQLMRL
jgi:hypothetical protein